MAQTSSGANHLVEPAKDEVGFGNLKTSEKSSMTLDTPKSVILACPFLSTKMLPWMKRLFTRWGEEGSRVLTPLRSPWMTVGLKLCKYDTPEAT